VAYVNPALVERLIKERMI